jgi:hypothetical protein
VTGTIPRAALDGLARVWPCATDFSAFNHVWDRHPDRRADPCVYLYPPGLTEGTTGLSFAEVSAIHRKKGFGAHSVVDGRGVVRVNEHAAHAFLDFLYEAQAAWVKYQQRLSQVPDLWENPDPRKVRRR